MSVFRNIGGFHVALREFRLAMCRFRMRMNATAHEKRMRSVMVTPMTAEWDDDFVKEDAAAGVEVIFALEAVDDVVAEGIDVMLLATEAVVLVGTDVSEDVVSGSAAVVDVGRVVSVEVASDVSVAGSMISVVSEGTAFGMIVGVGVANAVAENWAA